MQIRRFVQNVSGSHRAVERACRGADLPRGGRGSRLPAPSKRNRRCSWRRKGYQRRRCRCHDRISGRVASLHRAGGRGRLHARRLEVEESCVRRRRGIRWNVLRSACSGVRDGCARFLRCGYPRHRREIFCLLPSEVSCSSPKEFLLSFPNIPEQRPILHVRGADLMPLSFKIAHCFATGFRALPRLPRAGRK